MKLWSLCLSLCLLLASGVGATPLVSWTGTNTGFGTSGSFNLGYGFTVGPAGARVGGLGFFDYDGDGLLQSHPVGLWTAGGTLLASATVTTSDPLVPVGSQGHGFRFVTISDLFLAPGNYVLGAFYSNINDYYTIQPNGFSIAPGFTFTGSRFNTSGSLALPDTIIGAVGYFGPNLLLAVPELNGSTAGLPSVFVALGLLAVGGRRRR